MKKKKNKKNKKQLLKKAVDIATNNIYVIKLFKEELLCGGIFYM